MSLRAAILIRLQKRKPMLLLYKRINAEAVPLKLFTYLRTSLISCAMNNKMMKREKTVQPEIPIGYPFGVVHYAFSSITRFWKF